MSSSRADMFADTATDPRPRPPTHGDERATLAGFLDWHRATLELKCSGLGPEELARRAVPPSTLSLLGLVRHLAEVERGWMRRFMAGQDAPTLYASAERPDADFDDVVADAAMVAQAWQQWREEVDFARRFVAEAPDLDIAGTHQRSGRGMSLRWVLTHLVEEYARHNGHADLLRERIDGRLGQ